MLNVAHCSRPRPRSAQPRAGCGGRCRKKCQALSARGVRAATGRGSEGRPPSDARAHVRVRPREGMASFAEKRRPRLLGALGVAVDLATPLPLPRPRLGFVRCPPRSFVGRVHRIATRCDIKAPARRKIRRDMMPWRSDEAGKARCDAIAHDPGTRSDDSCNHRRGSSLDSSDRHDRSRGKPGDRPGNRSRTARWRIRRGMRQERRLLVVASSFRLRKKGYSPLPSPKSPRRGIGRTPIAAYASRLLPPAPPIAPRQSSRCAPRRNPAVEFASGLPDQLFWGMR